MAVEAELVHYSSFVEVVGIMTEKWLKYFPGSDTKWCTADVDSVSDVLVPYFEINASLPRCLRRQNDC